MLGSLLILSGAPSHPRLTDPSELNKNTVSYQAPSLWRLLRFAHGALHVSFKDLCGARGVQFCSVLHERTALDSRFTDDPLNVGHSLDSQAGLEEPKWKATGSPAKNQNLVQQSRSDTMLDIVHDSVNIEGVT